jgi:hypothetical protein
VVLNSELGVEIRYATVKPVAGIGGRSHPVIFLSAPAGSVVRPDANASAVGGRPPFAALAERVLVSVGRFFEPTRERRDGRRRGGGSNTDSTPGALKNIRTERSDQLAPGSAPV